MVGGEVWKVWDETITTGWMDGWMEGIEGLLSARKNNNNNNKLLLVIVVINLMGLVRMDGRGLDRQRAAYELVDGWVLVLDFSC